LQLIQSLEPRRHLSTYVPDLKFGTAGVVSNVSTFDFVAAQGNAIVTGGPFNGRGVRFARLRPDGTLDPTFGRAGMTELRDFKQSSFTTGSGLYAAQGTEGQATRVRVTRLDADGHVISRFGEDGVAAIDLPVRSPGRRLYLASVTHLKTDAAGRVLFIGQVSERISRQRGLYDRYVYVGRLTASGKIDRSFGVSGFSLVNALGVSSFYVDTGGRAVVQPFGTATIDSPVRFTSAGLPDLRFNRRAAQAFAQDAPRDGINGSDYRATSLDGDQVLVSLQRFNAIKTTTARPRVFRLDSTGRFDGGFGNNGVVLLTAARKGAGVVRTIIASDGTLFVTSVDTSGTTLLMHYSSAGQPLSLSRYATDEKPGNIQAIDASGRPLVRVGGSFVSRLVTTDVQAAVLLPGGVLDVAGTPGDDVITVDRIGAALRVSLNGRSTNVPAGGVKSIELHAFLGRDRVTVTPDVDTKIVSQDGGDTLTTAGGDDIFTTAQFSTHAEGSVFRTGDGDDTVSASDGDDRIVFGNGPKFVYTNDGDDTVTGGVGKIKLYGNGGTNHVTLAGGGGEISFYDSDDDITITGGGDYLIDVRDGRDRVTAGSGRDTIYAAGNDTIDAGAGNDTVGRNYEDQDVDRNYSAVVRGGPGNDNISFVDTLGSMTLYGDGGDDTLVGGYGRDPLFGGDGRDFLIGGDGNDTLRGPGRRQTFRRRRHLRRARQPPRPARRRLGGRHPQRRPGRRPCERRSGRPPARRTQPDFLMAGKRLPAPRCDLNVGAFCPTIRRLDRGNRYPAASDRFTDRLRGESTCP
jgi:hypothetical protein